MSKQSPRRIDKEEGRALQRELLRTINRIILAKDPQLLLDILTKSEKIMFGRRLQIAKRLIAGQSTQQILRELHVGQATVEGVDRWLQSSWTEYRQILPTIVEDARERARDLRKAEPVMAGTFREFRHRYPIHWGFLNDLFDDINEDWGKRSRAIATAHQSYEPVRDRRMEPSDE